MRVAVIEHENGGGMMRRVGPTETRIHYVRIVAGRIFDRNNAVAVIRLVTDRLIDARLLEVQGQRGASGCH